MPSTRFPLMRVFDRARGSNRSPEARQNCTPALRSAVRLQRGKYHIENPGERLGSLSAQDGLGRSLEGDFQCSRSLATPSASQSPAALPF